MSETRERQEVLDMVLALRLCKVFLEKRDEMNAAVHEDEPRYSPLTERVQEALKAWDEAAAILRGGKP